MQTMKADHEGGLKSFIHDQRALAGDVRFTLIQFDTANPCEVVYDRVPIAEVGDVTLVPRGGTPLLDAMGKALAHLEPHVAADDQVIVMVITDGEENESHEWTKAQVSARVDELQKRAWAFLFLGANLSAFDEARAIGIGQNYAMGYDINTDTAVQHAYAAASFNVGSSRSLRSKGGSLTAAASAMAFTPAQRKAARGAPVDDDEASSTTIDLTTTGVTTTDTKGNS